ncbi:hypothetical protein [Cytophaga aurantiaca]|uniref:hypothetical protein n=1 Tax=Cytophaga aurantiaca TaxID=29530 RepID=UPI00037F21C9|nr:hypothetical protein [Cytophaga aurantiaca]
MRFLTVIFFFIFIINSFAQHLRVENAKYAFNRNGKDIKDNDTLSVHSSVYIYQGGNLYLRNISGWGFQLTAGKYNIDSCYQVYKNIYSDYDSVKIIVNSIYPKGINDLLFKGTLHLERGATQDTHYSRGNIAFSNIENGGEKILNVGNEITLKWRDPKPTSGRYIVVFQNLFDEIICYRVVNSYDLNIDLNTLPNNNGMYPVLCKIYSDDYRMSTKILIQWE